MTKVKVVDPTKSGPKTTRVVASDSSESADRVDPEPQTPAEPQPLPRQAVPDKPVSTLIASICADHTIAAHCCSAGNER